MTKKPVKPLLGVVHFTKKQLMSLPADERELFLRVGLLINDLLLYQRLWLMLFYRKPKSEIATQVHAIQGSALLVALVGKTFEAMEVFRARFLSSPISRDYLPQFSEGNKKAVKYLRSLSGSSSLLAHIRNTHAFHFHKSPLTPFVEHMKDDHKLTAYLGVPDGNTLNAYAAEPFLYSLLEITGEKIPRKAMGKLQKETGKAIAALFQWGAGIQLIVLQKMYGKKPTLEHQEIRDDEYLPMDENIFSFFMSASDDRIKRQ